MAKRSPGTVSVITVPLKTEIWQEDVLNKRMELYRNVYNTMLNKRLKDLSKIWDLPEYDEAITKIRRVCSISNPVEMEKEKKSPSFKRASDTKNAILSERSFTEFGFNSIANEEARYFRENIPSSTVNLTIARPMWAAFEEYLYGGGRKVHPKNPGTFNSIASDGKSGIRLVNCEGETVYCRQGKEDLTLLFGTRGNKVLEMPLLIDPKNRYMAEMLTRSIHIIRIVRKKVKGRYKYSVQLTVDGAPAVKKHKNGKPIHKIKEAPLGIYIDTRYVTVAHKNGVKTFDLSTDDSTECEIVRLRAYIHASTVVSNPENYNPDGTLVKSPVKNGQKLPLEWNYSNGCKKAFDRIADLNRKAAENRKIRANIIANEILSMGNSIVVNDFTFKEPGKKQTALTGTPASIRKSIGQNAPAQILTILDRKLTSAGFDTIKQVEIKVNTSKENYREDSAKDLYSAACDQVK